MSERQRRWKPQPSTVIAMVALFVALVGTAYASVAANQVKSKHVKDNALKAQDLKDGAAVGSAEVIDESLTGADIGANAVGTSELADNAVNSAKVAVDSLLAGDLANDSVGSGEIAANAVGTGEIADNAVNSAKVAANTLTADDLANNSVESGEIAADAVGNSELADNSVFAAQFSVVGTLASDIGTVLTQRCTDRTFDPAVLNGSLVDDLVIVSPGTTFDGEFAVTAEAQDANTVKINICNNGPQADPDGAGPTTFRVVGIDFG